MKEAPLTDSGKTLSADKKFIRDIENEKYSNYVFTRLVAKDRRFTKVNFRYSFFEHSYLRDCHFDSCDFTGCRFTNTNLSGSKFSGCKFEYAYFEKTLVEPTILETECPSYENLKRSFARTLRTNFQQLGDASSANKAMTVELDANATHLRKAAWSNESYYRKHYAGVDRLAVVIEWIIFNILDLVWGNGESVGRLFRFLAIILFLMALNDTLFHGGDPEKIESYWRSSLKSFSLFFGTSIPNDYSRVYLALITCTRLVVVGFFLSIIIKRFNRR